MATIGATMMNTVMPMMKAGNQSGIRGGDGGSGRIGGIGARKARSGSTSKTLMVRAHSLGWLTPWESHGCRIDRG
jgi:hypothetical protein